MIKFHNRKEIDLEKWNHCISNSNNSNIYFYSCYLDAVTNNWFALIFDDYKALIRRLWRKTKFGYGEDKIEPIQNLFASSSYNLRYGTDSIDLDNTYL